MSASRAMAVVVCLCGAWTLSAGAQRAKTEGMAFGAPDNAAGSTAYSLELAGLTGEGGRNVGRGAAALALFGLGGAASVLRRRWS